MTRQCFLRCLLDSHPPIRLPHKVETIIGRSRITKIKDQSCSRQQLCKVGTCRCFAWKPHNPKFTNIYIWTQEEPWRGSATKCHTIFRFLTPNASPNYRCDYEFYSRNVSLNADCENCLVEVKQLGVNPSGLNSFALAKCCTLKVKHGSRIEILLNQYFHVLEFDPPPEDSEQRTGKRKLEDDDTVIRNKAPKLALDSKESSSIMETSVPRADTSSWEEIDEGELYVFTSKGTKSSKKIAGFDMDGTLIKTKSGKVFPVDTNDWQISFSNVTQKLKELLTYGFKIVILSNQAPIGNGRVKIEDFKKKLENIVSKLDVPIEAYIATGKGIYRKPATGMWKILAEQKNDGLEINMDESFYCGDAAGRLAKWAPGKKKDHSMADRLLAENLGLKFYTPEQFFLGHSVTNIPMAKPDFVPKELKSEPFNNKLISTTTEILVLVGFPGSGKSFLANQIQKRSGQRYMTVCRDVLGTWQKCAAKATEWIKLGKSVIVDSTNPDADSRARWTALAKDLKVECRCVKMATTKAHAQHNNKFRELMKIKHVPVNDIVFNTYKNKFTEPGSSEGFKEVIEVKFNPSFEDDETEKMYRMHLLEK